MKLVQLNIWAGKLLPQIIAFIEQEQPDILCLQEAYSSPGGPIYTPDPMFGGLERLLEATGYEHHFFSPTFTVNLSGLNLQHGNAILSRYPLLEPATHFIAGEAAVQADVSRPGDNIRNLQTAGVQVGGRRFSLANHHAWWEVQPLGSDMTVKMMRNVAAVLRTLPEPVVFAGDLNVTAASPAMRVFDGWLEDLTATHRVADTLSELGKARGVPCDHILVSAGVQVQRFRVSDALVSDHKALIMEFDPAIP